MKNPISILGFVLAFLCFSFSVIELYEVRTDWMAATIGFGFMFMFILFSLTFAYLRTLEIKFDQLTKILSDTFVRLAAIQQQNHERYSYGYPPPIHVTFQGNGVKWEADAMDFMSLEDLEKERKKAEKAEDYERAAIIQKKIDQKRKRL